MTFDTTTLTENQIALLKGILEDKFSEGPEFGAWFDSMVAAAPEQNIVKTKAQTKATLNQLIRKGLLAVDTTREEGSSWVTLTVAGGDALSAIVELPEAEAEEDDDDLLGDVTPAPVEAVEEEEEDLLGDLQVEVIEGTPADEVADALEELYKQEAEGDIDTITKDQVVTHTEMYTVNEWVDADETIWEETIFADGSRTLKRRRLVSNSWRTDYWGAEFTGDKEKATTAKLAKLARVTGHFTHTPAPSASAA